MLKLLHKGDEGRRRWSIIDIGRRRDAAYVPQLLARLDSDETHENKRHIVRALGNIGDDRAEKRLLDLLETSTGLMLGDVAHRLGQLNSGSALIRLNALMAHELDWVRQNARWAIAQIANGVEQTN